MDCPKCQGSMKRYTYGRHISILRCETCFGLFCDPEVVSVMKKEWMSEVLDVGDPGIGQKFDRVYAATCPVCSIALENKADPRQTHIWYEQCPSCDGIFFDAGEFSDWKYDTFMDRIRDLLKGRRT